MWLVLLGERGGKGWGGREGVAGAPRLGRRRSGSAGCCPSPRSTSAPRRRFSKSDENDTVFVGTTAFFFSLLHELNYPGWFIFISENFSMKLLGFTIQARMHHACFARSFDRAQDSKLTGALPGEIGDVPGRYGRQRRSPRTICCVLAMRPQARRRVAHRRTANFTGLVLGCIEAKFCK